MIILDLDRGWSLGVFFRGVCIIWSVLFEKMVEFGGGFVGC